jgi:hypothetical protein
MTPFSERAAEMGLDINKAYKGLYSYEDSYCKVVYRQLSPTITYDSDSRDPMPEHETDNMSVPLIGIFTKGPESISYKYCGYVSDMYKFVGNGSLLERVRESITQVGVPILREVALFDANYTRMRAEMFIQSSHSIPELTDIFPVMIVNNSYNGTKAASLAFGIGTNYNEREVLTFAFTLGEMRQVHIETSTTSLTSAVNAYMEVFNQDITQMITESFQKQVTEDDMMALLDVIQSLGKRRREEISTFLNEMQEQGRSPTAWQVFLAIVRYTSFEQNLNMKKMLENVAESVLVIPTRMHQVLNELGSS